MRLAIIATHPIQYHAPWFRQIAHSGIALRVFYLWDAGAATTIDHGFGHSVQWDVPLLSGYDYEFVPNTSRDPGTHHFFGLRNPSLFQRLRNYAPDAILVFGYNFYTHMSLLLRWRNARVPLIMRGDSHRLLVKRGIRESVRRALIAGVLSRFARLLYVGTANYQYYRYHGVATSKLFHAPHAVDNDRFQSDFSSAREAGSRWRRELGIPPHHRVVLFAGKWESKKAPLDLIHAFELANLSDVSLLLVGAGPLGDEVVVAAARHRHIYLAPFQNQSLMPRTYCAGDLFVLPSYGPAETWGLAINEAMNLGRPVIVSDHVGCAQDLVRPYENGLTFEAGNIAALAHALREAFSDTARLECWGRKSRMLVSEYSYERATAGLVAALNSLRLSC